MEMDKATSDNALKNLMQSLEADAAALQNNLNAVLSDAGCAPENKLRQLKKIRFQLVDGIHVTQQLLDKVDYVIREIKTALAAEAAANDQSFYMMKPAQPASSIKGMAPKLRK
ncbi:hypothetical protein [uncultured Phascolarctobacterium sp.]|uniref:hypothetical protein n=1 Tax=Phascolarctobacterium sp. TaxID=2049039 RepID=UPI0025DBB1CA|nr:hypothetical protein [uncultured Phascolarctobacterium sp.]